MGNAEERRKYKRIGYDMPFEYSLSILEFKELRKVTASARVIDVSEEGMGFFTDFLLEPGHVLRFKNGDGSFQTAMVRWVGEFDGKVRVGVLLYKK